MGARQDGPMDGAMQGRADESAYGPVSEAQGERVSDSTCEIVRSERRAFPRYTVDCAATITLLGGLGKIAGRMVDLSRGGCRLATSQRMLVGILARVEVQFQLRGLAFRIVGVTAGTRTGKSFAVRFLDLPRRREEELAEVLAEVANLAAEQRAAAEPQTTVSRTEEVTATAAVTAPASAAIVPAAIVEQSYPVISIPAGSAAPRSAPSASVPLAPKAGGDRRSSSRHAVDTRANLILVKGAICMPGQILNLSLGGCRVRTDERFSVGIYTRVEAEFYLHGLPFRVGGVSQAILDKNTVGIRFLDMSDRRRDQLAELMAEIAEAEAHRGAGIVGEPHIAFGQVDSDSMETL